MKNLIKNLKISNFKSIREAELECGRINLFLGKPNVGKSNVLEALALLAVYYNRNVKFMADFIRYDKLSHLFHYQNTENKIIIDTDECAATLSHWFEDNSYSFSFYRFPIGDEEFDIEFMKSQKPEEGYNYDESEQLDFISNQSEKWVRNYLKLDSEGKIINGNERKIQGCPIKKYTFQNSKKISTRGKNFLAPPHGDNLFWVLQTNKKLKEEIPDMFKEYGLEFLVDLEENKFAVQRKENGIAYKIPYHLIADTLQRIIFHYAAIFSNKDSVILFEEPESHSYPPYIRELANKIIDSQDNQFFITTHSPYLFDSIVENTPSDELAVFITYFEDYETKFKKLTDDELSDLMKYGTDIFFNLKWFIHE